MSREIIFKAKRKNWRSLPKEEWWVEGFYVPRIVDGKIVNYYILTGEASLEETKEDDLVLDFYKEKSNLTLFVSTQDLLIRMERRFGRTIF